MGNASGGSGGRGDAPLIQAPKEKKEELHGLLDFIAELETFHTMELKGGAIPEGFFTTKAKWKAMEIGFRTTFLSSLVTALMTPLAIGVVEKMIPVFGSAQPTPFDNVFVMTMSLSYLISYGCFLGQAARSFYGDYTHSMVKNLLQGIVGAAFIKVVIVVILFNWIYVSLLTQKNIVKALAFMTKWFPVEKLEGTYSWLMDFRPVLLTSAYFVVATTGLFLAIIFGCYLAALNRNRKLRAAGML